jgi:hypothetical protein
MATEAGVRLGGAAAEAGGRGGDGGALMAKLSQLDKGGTPSPGGSRGVANRCVFPFRPSPPSLGIPMSNFDVITCLRAHGAPKGPLCLADWKGKSHS